MRRVNFLATWMSLALWAALAGCSKSDPAQLSTTPVPDALPSDVEVQVPDGVEMIFWEDQSWEVGGDSNRLTLWADGRSEIYLFSGFGETGPGWTKVREDPFRREYRKDNPFSPEESKRRFHAALAAGIHELKPFEITYSDGGGTLVGVQINGQLEERVIPLFHNKGTDEVGSQNHRRYLAVERIMSDFPREPVIAK